MRIEYTSRNIDITPGLKEHVLEKLGHVARTIEDVVGAHVILAKEKYRHIAEIIVRRRRGTLTGQAASRDMYQSIQKAVDRIESQMRRKREKLLGRKRRGAVAKTEAATARRVRLPPMVAPPVVEEPALRVIEEAADRIKPIAVEEAVLLLEEASRPFVVFRNSSTGRMGVLYRRGDGNYGLVESRD